MVDMTVDVANTLHSLNIGVFDPVGSSGNILVEFSPESPIGIISIYQLGGGPREINPSEDIRRPVLHIEYCDVTRQKVKQKLSDLADTLHKKSFYTPLGSYFFRLQSEVVVIKLSDELFKGYLNFYVMQVVN